MAGSFDDYDFTPVDQVNSSLHKLFGNHEDISSHSLKYTPPKQSALTKPKSYIPVEILRKKIDIIERFIDIDNKLGNCTIVLNSKGENKHELVVYNEHNMIFFQKFINQCFTLQRSNKILIHDNKKFIFSNSQDCKEVSTSIIKFGGQVRKIYKEKPVAQNSNIETLRDQKIENNADEIQGIVEENVELNKEDKSRLESQERSAKAEDIRKIERNPHEIENSENLSRTTTNNKVFVLPAHPNQTDRINENSQVEDNKSIIAYLSQISSSLSKLAEVSNQKQNENSTNQSRIKALELKIANLQNEISSRQKSKTESIDKLSQTEKDVAQQRAEQNLRQTIAQQNNDIESLKKEIERLKNRGNLNNATSEFESSLKTAMSELYLKVKNEIVQNNGNANVVAVVVSSMRNATNQILANFHRSIRDVSLENNR